MNDKFTQSLAERFRELDQPIQVDATELTSRVALIREKRRRNKSRIQSVAVFAMVCFVISGFAWQMLPLGVDGSAVATNPIDDEGVTFSLTEFEFPMDSIDQVSELNRLKTELAALKQTSKAQNLTLVRESISRTMFSNDSTLNLFE